MRFILLTLILSLLQLSAATTTITIDPTTIPDSVTKLQKEFKQKKSDAYQDYLKEAKKLQEDYRNDLGKAMKRETQDGNLDGALAIRALIDSLDNPQKPKIQVDPTASRLEYIRSRMAQRNASTSDRANDFMGAAPKSGEPVVLTDMSTILGKPVRVHGAEWQFNEDKTVLFKGYVYGTWDTRETDGHFFVRIFQGDQTGRWTSMEIRDGHLYRGSSQVTWP